MISLPVALQTVLTIGGVNVETDASAVVTSIHIDYVSKVMTMNIAQGTVVGQTFTQGQYPPTYQFIVNMVTGIWSFNGTNLSGTFNAQSIAAISALFLPLRNQGETFVMQQNLFPSSTQTAWTTI